MSKIIIHTNSNGGVSVTIPTGELPIEEVLTKDCPEGAIIVDESTLPQGADAFFFDAWTLLGTTISVNFAKAQADKLTQYNASAIHVAQARQLNVLAGLPNFISDEDFLAKLIADRVSIANATTTDELVLIANPI